MLLHKTDHNYIITFWEKAILYVQMYMYVGVQYVTRMYIM
jgi:hypothetical protein